MWFTSSLCHGSCLSHCRCMPCLCRISCLVFVADHVFLVFDHVLFWPRIMFLSLPRVWCASLTHVPHIRTSAHVVAMPLMLICCLWRGDHVLSLPRGSCHVLGADRGSCHVFCARIMSFARGSCLFLTNEEYDR